MGQISEISSPKIYSKYLNEVENSPKPCCIKFWIKEEKTGNYHLLEGHQACAHSHETWYMLLLLEFALYGWGD